MIMTRQLLPLSLLISLAFTVTNAFTSTTASNNPINAGAGATSSTESKTESASQSRVRVKMSMRNRERRFRNEDEKDPSKCEPCPEPEGDLDMDRREAAFAMIGSLWSAAAIPSAALTMLGGGAQVAEAVYGADAKIEVPNVMDSMSDRVNKQCLVESLGNRECLVYLDPENALYKGVDSKLLLERLEQASVALSQIPALAAEKKWSKVQGIITGPMAPLGMTMDKLSKLSANEEKSCRLEKAVKADLYAISAAVERKQGDKIMEMHKKATEDLVAYAKAL